MNKTLLQLQSDNPGTVLSRTWLKQKHPHAYSELLSYVDLYGFSNNKQATHHLAKFNTLDPNKVCAFCEANYRSNALSFFCSLACRNRSIASDEKNRAKHKESMRKHADNLTHEDKKRISERNHRRWARLTEEERRCWSSKMLSTMGESGIKERTKKALKTKLKRGIINGTKSYTEERKQYKRYYNRVMYHTKKLRTVIEGFELVDKHNFHLDHIFPISKGYKYNIPEELIWDKMNLRVINALTNKKKSDKIVEIPDHINQYLKSNQIDIENKEVSL